VGPEVGQQVDLLADGLQVELLAGGGGGGLQVDATYRSNHLQVSERF